MLAMTSARKDADYLADEEEAQKSHPGVSVQELTVRYQNQNQEAVSSAISPYSDKWFVGEGSGDFLPRCAFSCSRSRARRS